VRVRESFAHICLLGTVVLQAITSGAQPVTKIAAGISRSLLLKSDGTLWTVGYVGPLEMEADGGTNNKTNQPPQPPQLVASNVTAMAAGGYHTLFLKSDGSLWAKGANQFGQLGDGTYGTFEQTNGPEQIVGSNIIAIVAGNQFSLFLKRNGSLWGMGWNSDGQLGDGTSGAYAQTNRPEQIVASNVTAIAAGESHSLFVKRDGSLWAMGDNTSGELGDNLLNNTNRTEQILGPYNRIIPQLLSASNIHLCFVGIDRTNYTLERSFKAAPANWVPQATNAADSVGVLVFTNAPNPATNYFWRIHSVP